MEQNLQNSYFEQLFENSPLAIVFLDQNGKVVKINKSFKKIFQYDDYELEGQEINDPILANFRDENELLNSEKILAGEPVEKETIRRKKDGTPVEVHIIAVPITSESGVKGIFVIYEDISNRKRTEDLLQDETQTFLSSLQEAPYGVMLPDKDGKILFLNTQFTKITGYGYEDISTINEWADKVYPDKEYKEKVSLIWIEDAAKKSVVTRNFKIMCSDGKFKDIELKVNFLEDGRLILMLSDITEKLKLEDGLLKIEKLESLGMLAGGIAHDFNNILSAIIGNIGLARQLLTGEEKVFQIISDAEKAAIRAAHLTQQLLTFSKGGEPVKKAGSIAKLIQDSVTFALRGSKVKCEFNISPDLWCTEFDEGQINQVINNIVLNAKQAMPNGGSIGVNADNVIDEEIIGLPVSRRKYIKVSFIDQGIGIPEKYLKKIFDPYFTTKQDGSGLGLATSFSIIKKHDGYIDVFSKAGEGSTFIIYLPAIDAHDIVQLEVSHQVIMGKGKILLMDDEDMVRNVGGEMLSYLGYEVELAKNGYETLGLFIKAKESNKSFNAVILDLTIPGEIGGLDTFTQLLKIDPKIIGIVSSGYSDDPILVNYKNYGFAGIVIKPYKIEELSETLDRVLNSKK